MSSLSPLGASTLPASLFAANQPAAGKTANASASQQAAGASANPVSLSSDGLDLQKRVASVGNATVDYAQHLMDSFTQALLGDTGKNASISFDSASLETESSIGVALQHSQGPNGSSDAAAFRLTDSSHFIGKGTITTADGRKFDFEVEVQYNYELDAGASQTTTAANGQPAAGGSPDSANGAAAAPGNKPVATNQKPTQDSGDSLPNVQVPNIDFPGTLADLFKLIGHDLQSALSNGDQSTGPKTGNGIDRNTLRNLSLRLLNLVDHKSKDTYAPPTGADKAKSVSDAYGTPAPADTSAPAPAATAPAAPAAAAPAAPAPAAPAAAAPAADAPAPAAVADAAAAPAAATTV